MEKQGKLCPRIGRAKEGRIVNVHGDNKKDEEIARQFVRLTKASIHLPL